MNMTQWLHNHRIGADSGEDFNLNQDGPGMAGAFWHYHHKKIRGWKPH
jgi:hypothetical protein